MMVQLPFFRFDQNHTEIAFLSFVSSFIFPLSSLLSSSAFCDRLNQTRQKRHHQSSNQDAYQCRAGKAWREIQSEIIKMVEQN